MSQPESKDRPWWQRMPLYLQILVALILATVLLLTNTVVAILIGLLVANVLQPGTWGHLSLPENTEPVSKSLDPWGLLQDAIPESIIKPLVDNNVIQLIILA